jgi:EmrB/QacA subfamily drug resistance transporter
MMSFPSKSDPNAPALPWGSPGARWVLLSTVLASGLVFLDGTSSNVALPAIGDDLGVGMSELQWTINAYTLSLAALILLGGSLGDRYGRRRIFTIGLVWFTVASLLCGLAQDGLTLILARALQGVGGALLTPGSLAIIQTTIAPEDRARAVGAWSGLSGIAAALGPLAGGWLVDIGSWRLIFLTNIPIAAVALYVTLRYVPETRNANATGEFDRLGPPLAVLGLAATTWALIEIGARGLAPLPAAVGILGVITLAAFILSQRTASQLMMPLAIFASKQFNGANLVTVAVYGVYTIMLFLLMIHLQQVLGYSPLQAGLAAMPITMLLLPLSAPAGQLAQRIGPRIPMTVGPLLIALGILLMARIGVGSSYLTDVFPGVILFGLGLTLTAAPLTATVLAAVPEDDAGIASATNNAVSRAAGLAAIAVIPGLAGLSGDSLSDPAAFASGFRVAMLISSGIALAGALCGWFLIQNQLAGGKDACPYDRVSRQYHCSVGAPPLEPGPDWPSTETESRPVRRASPATGS